MTTERTVVAAASGTAAIGITVSGMPGIMELRAHLGDPQAFGGFIQPPASPSIDLKRWTTDRSSPMLTATHWL